MSMLDDTSAEVDDQSSSNRGSSIEDSIEYLRQDIDHLKSCFEQLIDIIDNQTDAGEELMLINDRMSLFERRVQRAEDGVADLSWVFRRRAGDS